MIIPIEQPAAAKSANGFERQIDTRFNRDDHSGKRAAGRFGYPRDVAEKPGRALVFSSHTHYDPLQVAIEEGLDAWARHAAASNGFGDLP